MRARLAISSVITAALLAGGPGFLPALAQPAATTILVDGSTTVGPIAKAFAEHYMSSHKEVNITVSESGSGNGAKSLLNGTADVATMSRPMKESELAAAQESKIQPVEHVVAMDGLAVVVHPSNPLGALTLDQVREIYLGKVANWKQLGGPDMAIVVVSRDTNSGTYETFETLVMNKEKMAAGIEYLGSNGAIRQKVQSTPGAIGYVGLGFVDRTLKALVVNGVAPSPETVLSGAYPLARPLYMYTRGRPQPDTHLYAFVMLSQTPEGRKIIEGLGFVPLPEAPSQPHE
jgi:phosphate transport system substrate-binding protein